MDFDFKPLTEEYLEWARLLHNDPEVIAMLTDPHLVTSEEQICWFTKLQNSKSSKRLIVFNECNISIGLIRLDNIDLYNKSISVGLDIHKDYRGKGYAKPIYRKLFKELFEEQDFNRIALMVAEYNLKAKHIYESLGFKEEGLYKEALLKDGVFYNYVLMSILRNEYYALSK